MSTLILGIGNPILSDDGVGIRIAQRLKEEKPYLEVETTSEAAITLLDLVVGYNRLIIIDSIKTGQGKPGELYKLKLEDFKPAMDSTLSHGIDIATAFELGESLGYKMPQVVSMYAVEIRDNQNFAEKCTEEVEGKIPFIVREIIDEEKL